MLKNASKVIIRNCRLNQPYLIRCLSSTTPSASKEKWDLYAGVLVERPPVVSKTLNPFEKEFQDMLWQVEFENSLKSNHEMKHERDILQATLIKKGKMEVDLDESATQQTAQDLKDAYKEELKQFKFAPRITPDDEKKNTASTNRCLEDTLYLLVEQKIGKQSHFLLPQGLRQDGETMRQTAERILREKCGNALEVLFFGNAPCGFYKYKYPLGMRDESVGAKIFFYRALSQKGNVDKAQSGKFEWLAKAALDGKIKNESYSDSIHKFVL